MPLHCGRRAGCLDPLCGQEQEGGKGRDTRVGCHGLWWEQALHISLGKKIDNPRESPSGPGHIPHCLWFWNYWAPWQVRGICEKAWGSLSRTLLEFLELSRVLGGAMGSRCLCVEGQGVMWCCGHAPEGHG